MLILPNARAGDLVVPRPWWDRDWRRLIRPYFAIDGRRAYDATTGKLLYTTDGKVAYDCPTLSACGGACAGHPTTCSVTVNNGLTDGTCSNCSSTFNGSFFAMSYSTTSGGVCFFAGGSASSSCLGATEKCAAKLEKSGPNALLTITLQLDKAPDLDEAIFTYTFTPGSCSFTNQTASHSVTNSETLCTGYSGLQVLVSLS